VAPRPLATLLAARTTAFTSERTFEPRGAGFAVVFGFDVDFALAFVAGAVAFFATTFFTDLGADRFAMTFVTP